MDHRSGVNAAWTAAGRPAGELVGKTPVVTVPARLAAPEQDPVAAVVGAQPDLGYVAQRGAGASGIGGQPARAAQVGVQHECAAAGRVHRPTARET